MALAKYYSLYDKVYKWSNLQKAFANVKKNKGAPGIDHVTIQNYELDLEDNLGVLQEKLRTKSYKPLPVRRTYIEKEDRGKKRPLGIPAVEDRIVQAALRQIIEPIFEEDFLPCSYGFRPKRSAHMAIDQVSAYLKEGYTYVIDADLQSYFDTIPHDQLETCIRKRIVDGSIINLIHLFLKAGVMEDGSVKEGKEGTPQGGVISPLLSNIYLHQLDELMTKRGHRIVRFADDFIVLCRSAKGSERVMRGIKKYVENDLKLTVHPTKSVIVNAEEEPFTFLGYEFYRNYRGIAPKKEKTFKEKVKRLTRRNQTLNIEVLVDDILNPYLRGWANYFRFGHVATKFKKWDAWIRRRLRMVQLRSWRNRNSLYRVLRKKGWNEESLHPIRMTAWRSSKTHMVHTALDNSYFEEIGLVSLRTIYEERYSKKNNREEPHA